MFNQFQKDLFQRILSNYVTAQGHLDDMVAAWFNAPTLDNMLPLIHNLSFYGRLKCLDPVSVEASLSRMLQPMRAIALAKPKADSSPSRQWPSGLNLHTEPAHMFSVTSFITEIVASFVSLVGKHDNAFVDIEDMNQLRSKFSGVIGMYDFTYYDLFCGSDYPVTSFTDESDLPRNPEVKVPRHDELSFDAELLTYPASLYTWFLDHVGEAAMVWEDTDSNEAYALIIGNASEWLEWQLSYAKQKENDEIVHELALLLGHLDQHVRRASIGICSK